jgi:hypothetical protein
MEQHKGVATFENELKAIEFEDIRAFTHNAIVASPPSFWKDKELVTYTKKVFKVVKELLEHDKVKSPIKDVILAGVLLSDIAYNELSDQFKHLHPIAAGKLLEPVSKDVNKALLEGILRIIEAHEGDQTPSKLLEPKPGTPEHLVSIAHRLVKNQAIHVEIDY